MVFAAMEGVKEWRLTGDGGGRAAKARRRAVQRIIRNVLTRTLKASPGSYLCRLQEDEFKYMTAFPRQRWAQRTVHIGNMFTQLIVT
jgi:hypothetical protein